EQGKGRLIGNIVLEADFIKQKIVGFENHGGRTYIGSHKPLGRVVYGYGNEENAGAEGVVYKNVVATYLHGPLLPKNPQLCDYILTNALKHKYPDFKGLEALEDKLENTANEYIVKRFVK
ncbi:MAG: glutamine amidotransferase, partial [Candidatus Ornithomonoglobus sp.]